LGTITDRLLDALFLGYAEEPPDLAGRFGQDGLLPKQDHPRAGIRSKSHGQLRIIGAACVAEPRLLGRIEHGQNDLRLGQMLDDSRADLFGAGQKILAGVVVEDQQPSEPTVMETRVGVGRLEAELQRDGESYGGLVDSAGPVEPGVVSLGLADLGVLVGLGIKEQCSLVFVDGAVGKGVGVAERQSGFGQQSPQLPDHRGQEVRLAAGGRTDQRYEQRGQLQHRPGDVQPAARAGHVGRGESLGVDGLAAEGEMVRHEPSVLLWPQHAVAQKAGVLGYEE